MKNVTKVQEEVALKQKVKTIMKTKKENVIEIKEEVVIKQNGEVILLEKGDKIEVLPIEEAIGKDGIGTGAEKLSWAVKIKGVPSNYGELKFGQQLSYRRQNIEPFLQDSKKAFVNAKGISTVRAVRQWVKDNKPSEYYAKWQSDSPFYKDDVVEIFYK